MIDIEPLRLPEELNKVLFPNPKLLVNPSSGIVEMSACIARTGVQSYLREEVGLEGEGMVGVYRGGTFIKKLAQRIAGTVIIFRHNDFDANDLTAPAVIGLVKSAKKVAYEGEVFCVAQLVFHHAHVVDEIAEQLAAYGEAILPLSPSYIPSKKPKQGTWVDTLGLLVDPGESVPYLIEQTPESLQINHLAVVDFGRGGETAQAYCKESVQMEDNMFYEYPQVRLNADNPTSEEDKMTEDQYKSMQDALDALNKNMQDMMAKPANDMTAMKDAMKELSDKMADMSAMKDAMTSMKESNDALVTKLSGLAAAINATYEGEDNLEAPTQAAQAKAEAGGESKNFLFDSLVESQKLMADALTKLATVQAEAPVDDSLPSYRNRQGVKGPVNDGIVENDDGSLTVL